MPVTDPGSYAYYVEILKKDLEKIENQIKNIEEVKNVYEESKKIYDSMNGVYSEVKDYYDKYQQIRERISGSISTSKDFAQTYMDKAENMDEYLKDNGFVDVGKVLDEAFKDVRNPANETTVFNEGPKRRAMIQSARRKAIVEAEEIAEMLPADMKRLQEMMGKIEEAEDLKASQDLTNHFLGEILGVTQELKALLSRDIAARQLAEYEGVDGQDVDLVKSPKVDPDGIKTMLEAAKENNKSGINWQEL